MPGSIHYETKHFIYGQIARIGKAVASPKRLELLDLLCQGEKTVETLCERAEINMKLASAHLRELKAVHLVETRRDGKYIYYRAADNEIAGLWVHLRDFAEQHLGEMRIKLKEQAQNPDELAPFDRKTLLEKAKAGDIVLIDVRPEDEFKAGHLPHAISLPLARLRKNQGELPKNKLIVTYCRGSCCLQANEAVRLLRRRGYQAARIKEGAVDWVAAGLSVIKEKE